MNFLRKDSRAGNQDLFDTVTNKHWLENWFTLVTDAKSLPTNSFHWKSSQPNDCEASESTLTNDLPSTERMVSQFVYIFFLTQ